MYAKQYDLKLVKAPFDIPPIELQMQWHKYRDQNPALVWFRELLQSVAREIWLAMRQAAASAVYATSYSTNSFAHFVLRLLQPTVVLDDVFCQLHPPIIIRMMHPPVSRKHPKASRPLPRLAPMA